MKVTETITRDCCAPKDLRPVEGSPFCGREVAYKFCVHCGARHKMHTYTDAAGASEWEYRKMREALVWP